VMPPFPERYSFQSGFFTAETQRHREEGGGDRGRENVFRVAPSVFRVLSTKYGVLSTSYRKNLSESLGVAGINRVGAESSSDL
jgi:hypothetical protein